MKILFLTDNFPPEVNAPASRTFGHCKEWVKAGEQVTVITCVPNYPQGKVYDGYKNKLYQKETIDGINVIRVFSYITQNKGVIKRTLDYMSYAFSAFLVGLFQKCDVIIATSPQFFTALAGRRLAFIKRKPWIMEVRDLWPESIKTVGAMKDNMFIHYFEYQEKRCYKKANRIVAVTDSFKTAIIQRGGVDEKISVIKNGVDKSLFTPIEKDSQLIKELHFENKFVIGYIGTHGMAHKLDFILKCAKKLENTNYHFLFLGDGAEKENLLKLKESLALDNVTMLGSVPKVEVKRYISILDVCLINLKKSPLFTTVIPSKIFENAAMQKPILIGVEGEAKQLVESYDAGIGFEPENEQDFILKLEKFKDNKFYEHCKQGCEQLAKDFDRQVLAKRMLQEIYKTIKT